MPVYYIPCEAPFCGKSGDWTRLNFQPPEPIALCNPTEDERPWLSSATKTAKIFRLRARGNIVNLHLYARDSPYPDHPKAKRAFRAFRALLTEKLQTV
jgi:hypothetical protein